MNKRHGIIAVALVALLLVTGCSTFFTGSVKGTVTYKGTGIPDVKVAVYFDEGQCDADLASYKTNHVFNTRYTENTNQRGEFVISNIPWDNAFPEYGKDADEKSIYLLFYHDDYGIQKYNASAVMVSGRNNVVNFEFKDKAYDSDKITLSFVNAANGKPSHDIKSFTYSYYGRPQDEPNEAYEVDVDVPETGTVELNVKYLNDEGQTFPKVTIKNIKTKRYNNENEPYAKAVVYDKSTSAYKLPEKGEFVLDLADSDNKVANIEVMPYIMDFGGFHGTIYANKYAESDVVVTLLDESGHKLDSVIANAGSSDTVTSPYYTYSDLGSDIQFKNTDLKADYNNKYTIKMNIATPVEGAPAIEKTREAVIGLSRKANDDVMNFNFTVKEPVPTEH